MKNMNNYADVLESYMIAEEAHLKDDLKALLITAGIFTPIIAAGVAIDYKYRKAMSKRQEEAYKRELEKLNKKYSEYKNETKSFSSVDSFITAYNSEIENKTWISVAKLPNANIVVDDIIDNLQCDKILSEVYSKIEQFRNFANGNNNGDNPHKDTLKKKLLPSIIIGKSSVNSIIFSCDPDEGEFIAEVYNFSNKNGLLPQNNWNVSYSD